MSVPLLGLGGSNLEGSATCTAPLRHDSEMCSTGDIYGPKPYKFKGVGDIHGPKPRKFMGFGDIHGPKPYKFIKEPRTFERIRPEIFDFEPECGLKRGRTAPKIPGTVAGDRHTTIPNDSGRCRLVSTTIRKS